MTTTRLQDGDAERVGIPQTELTDLLVQEYERGHDAGYVVGYDKGYDYGYSDGYSYALRQGS